MNEQVLKIKLGEEYKARIEKIEEFEKSLFKSVYEDGFKSVKDIISSKNNDKQHENYNNIITFIGERGTGKTSCMISFAEALKDIEDKVLKLENYNKLKEKECKYNVIEVIDPSLLIKNSNILEIILANMFKSFKKELEDDKKNIDQDKKRKALKAFTRVFDNLKTINSSKENLFENDSIDALLKLSASSDLKVNMSQLVNKYLDFIEGEKGRKVLVIQVDDMDLNTKHAYEMIEQIRKYLIIPNVIILMAVKLDQLSDVVKQNLLIENKESLSKNVMNISEITSVTEKYLTKLIPQGRRLYLPELKNLDKNIEVEIYNNDNNETLEITIRKLIYEKTGFIFLNSENRSSYIVPDNLREVINLINVLYSLNDYKNIDKEKVGKNRLVFKNYFFKNWCKNNLKEKQTDILKELLERDPKEKNKYIINKIEEIYSLDVKEGKDQNIDDKAKEYKKIIDLGNNPLNISLGDVLFTLDRLDHYKIDNSEKKFIFAIKTIYSIMLYEFDYLEEEKIEYNKVSQLIGGSLINAKHKDFMRKDIKFQRRHSRDINYKLLCEIKKIKKYEKLCFFFRGIYKK